MANDLEDLRFELETAVAEFGLRRVAEALTQICRENAEWSSRNPTEDGGAPQVWITAADKLGFIAGVARTHHL